MRNITFFLLAMFISTVSLAQTYQGPESVEYDFANNRWLIGNKNSNQILARDINGNLSVLIPQSSIGSTGPYGIEIVGDVLYACCGSRVKGFNLSTLEEVFNVNTGGTFLNGITHDNAGNLIVTDFSAKVIYKLNIAAETSTSIASGLVQSPNGIIFDETNNRCIFVNWGSNAPIKSINLADNTVSTLITTAYSNCDGIAVDGDGNYYISVWGGNQCVKYNSDFSSSPVQVVSGLSSPADIFFNVPDMVLGIPNSGNNTVTFVQFQLSLPEMVSPSALVHPNPTQAEINIELPQNSRLPTLISVYDVSGKWVCSLGNEAFSTASNRIQLNIDFLSPGVYLLNLHMDGPMEILRIVKE